MNRPKQQHEDELKKTLNDLTNKGWKVVDLKGKSPDAVAVKDNKLIAIEVLGIYGKNDHGWTYTGKKNLYGRLGFDEVVIYTFNKIKGG